MGEQVWLGLGREAGGDLIGVACTSVSWSLLGSTDCTGIDRLYLNGYVPSLQGG